MMKKSCLLLLLVFDLAAGAQRKKVDLLIFNARIYTVDAKFSMASAMAVKDGKIVEVGRNGIREKYWPAQSMDAGGKSIYPGFIDAHTHFYRYGLGLQTVNLVDTKSWNEIISKLEVFSNDHSQGWLIGRGWDQNDWDVKEFPNKDQLDHRFPNRPVLLTRIDGHAAIANQKALDLAGIQPGQKLTGGTVETKNGRLTGLLIDNAVDLVTEKIPAATSQQIVRSLLQGQENCFAVGLTTVDDCGLDYREALLMDSLQKSGILKMRVYALLSDAPHNFRFLFARGRIKTDRMHIRSFKVYADGALGSRGACLLQPYSDRPDWHGFLLSTKNHFDSVASIISQNGMQMCTHAIGDSGNRTILNIYAKHLRGKNDHRWRIEHAQVVHPDDFSLFGKYSVVPSVQPTHATSDMYWAQDRLGPQRVKGAYAFRQLMNENGWIPLGTDFPVEDISPLKTFHSAVFRTDAKDYPAGGYQVENALSRQQALRGMTIWAARSNFEEKEKGSLEKGKLADFVILNQDIMSIAPGEILKTQVLVTYINGEKVYQKK